MKIKRNTQEANKEHGGSSGLGTLFHRRKEAMGRNCGGAVGKWRIRMICFSNGATVSFLSYCNCEEIRIYVYSSIYNLILGTHLASSLLTFLIFRR
jgi:hypothetical protein